MFHAKFDIKTFFSLKYVEGKQQICCQSVICNRTLVLMHCVKMNQGYESILNGATPPEKKSRYVNETSRADSLYT